MNPSIDVIILLIQQDAWMTDVLRIVQELHLPDSWVGAGFIRNKVWDWLHHYPRRTMYEDIDIIYFDKSQRVKNNDKELEKQLNNDHFMGIKWSVKNQARMHLHNNDHMYHSTYGAISHWTETATCIAVRLNLYGELKLIAPYGVDDLLNLIVRPTPYISPNIDVYRQRMRAKKWKQNWPRLTILDLS